MNIDWSKAPDGATHYRKGNSLSFFRDVEKSGFYFWNEHQPQWRWVEGAFPADANPIAPTWNGEGLPPVGSTVEALVRELFGDQEWEEVKVIAHDEGAPIVKWNYGYFSRDLSTLRPIRTPEQIAAEERDKAVMEIYERANKQGCSVLSMLMEAYDAGCRKTEG